MSLVKANGAGEVSTGFYNGATSRSLRMQDARLTRTPSSTGDPKKWTFSAWLKRTSLGQSYIFAGSPLSSGYDGIAAIYFNGSDQLHTYYDTSGSNPYGAVDDGSRVYRDLGSWYHLCWAVDAANTIHKIWINNVLVSTNTGRYPPNFTYGLNNAGDQMVIGDGSWDSYGSPNFNGYMAEINYLDGQYLEPDSFTETKEGVLIPLKDPSLTYGTNGFRLQFLATGTSADSSGIGADTSGQGNHYAVTSLAAGDVVLDNPENNFAILNKLIDPGQRASATYSEGNLQYTSSDSYDTAISTIGVNSGKYYFESRFNSNGFQLIGLRQDPFTQKSTYIGQNSANSGIAYSRAISSVVNSTAGTTSSVGSASSGDIAQVAFDADNGYVWFGINNTYYGTVDSSTGRFTLDGFVSGKDLFPAVGYRDSQTLNFGQDGSFANALTGGDVGTATDGNGKGAFKYAPPSGYLALCSANLPDVTIGPDSTTQADDHFDTILRVGHGTSGGSTPANFKADWIWEKVRNSAYSHYLIDSSRGIVDGSTQVLITNTTNLETTGNWYKPPTSSSLEFNTNDWASSFNLVDWIWKANGGTTTTNDASSTGVGTIDSVFQANTTSGFSIVTYTGTGSAGTVKHGLSVAPSLVIIKSRTGASVPNWVIGQDISGFTGQLYFDTGAFSTNSGSFNNTAPTTSVVSIGTDSTVNQSTATYVMYCFANVEGFSRVGSYIGNGNADGTFVFTGFRPAFLLIKSTGSSTNGWYIYDNKRLNYGSLVDGQLYANLANAEDDGNRDLDFLSNGFKPRLTDTNVNASGTTFVYLAFAEQPFKFSNAR